MKVLLEINFDFEESENCTNEEFKNCLKEVLRDGSDCTNTDLEVVSMQTEIDMKKYQDALDYISGEEERDLQCMINSVNKCKLNN